MAAAFLLTACAGARYHTAYPAGGGEYYVAQTPAQVVYYGSAYSRGLYAYGLHPWWEFGYYSPNFYPHYFFVWQPHWHTYYRPGGVYPRGFPPGPYRTPVPQEPSPPVTAPVIVNPDPRNYAGSRPDQRYRLHDSAERPGATTGAMRRAMAFPQPLSPRTERGMAGATPPPTAGPSARTRALSAPVSPAVQAYRAPSPSSVAPTRAPAGRSPARHEP